MDASDLRIFAAVARLGGMNRAAAILNTVQSNVTTRVRLLEEELGTVLFDRHSRGVSLTAAGRRLLPYADRVRDLLDEARRAVDDDGTPKGALVVGSLETTVALRLAPRLSDFVARHPKVELALRTGTTAELVEQVLNRQLDGAFVCGPVQHPELAEETIFRERLAVLSAPGAGDLRTLLGRPAVTAIVLRTGCSYRQRFEDYLAQRGVVDLRRIEFGTLEAIFGCVAAGLGLTMLPRALIGPVWSAERVAVHDVPDADAAVSTVFIRRRDAFLSSALAALLRHVGDVQADAAAAE